jgi:hypothetical protein
LNFSVFNCLFSAFSLRFAFLYLSLQQEEKMNCYENMGDDTGDGGGDDCLGTGGQCGFDGARCEDWILSGRLEDAVGCH